jgi:hypothetical protein
VTALAVLATANHFLLDLAGGLVAMAIALLIVRLAPGWSELRRIRTWRVPRRTQPWLSRPFFATLDHPAYRRGSSPYRRGLSR